MAKTTKAKKQQEDAKKRAVFRITESRIKKLLDFEHLEELFHVLNMLNDKQVESFIKHYKASKDKTKDKKIDKIIKESSSRKELIEKIKDELVAMLNSEYALLKEEISSKRKSGKDVYIEDLKLMSVPGKIKMFNATSDKKDFYSAKKILHEVRESLKLVK